MSSQQVELDEYDGLDRPATGGISDSDRPRCGVTASWNGEPCKNLAIPTLGVCHNHLDHVIDDDGPDSDDKPIWERNG